MSDTESKDVKIAITKEQYYLINNLKEEVIKAETHLQLALKTIILSTSYRGNVKEVNPNHLLLDAIHSTVG